MTPQERNVGRVPFHIGDWKMMSKLWRQIASMLIVSGLAFGCASIMKGTRQDLSVTSSPSDATVEIRRGSAAGEGERVFAGATPATAELSRKHEYVVTVSMDGYRTAKIPVTKDGIQPWWWGNIALLSLLGIVIDYVDGAMYRLEPATIHVSMETAAIDGAGDGDLCAIVLHQLEDGRIRRIRVPMVSISN